MTTTHTHRTSIATIQLIDEQIIENIIDENATVDTKDLLEIKQANLNLTKGKKYVILVNSGNFSTITKEARELSASKEFMQNTIAKALLVNSLAQLIIGRFYIKINKPHIKTELFKDRNEAIKWLQKIIKKSKKQF